MSDRIVSGGDLTPEQRRIHRVEHILRRDGGSPRNTLEGLAAIIEDGTWHKVPAGPDLAESFASFTAFVEAHPPYGLGYSVRQLRALLQLQHPDEDKKEAVRERMEAMRAEIERLLTDEIPALAAHGAIGNGRSRDGATISTPKANYAEQVIARLKRDDPELAASVVAGELSPNAAARNKGWRKARIVVSSPERTAESLRKHMPAEARRALARLLLDEEDLAQ